MDCSKLGLLIAPLLLLAGCQAGDRSAQNGGTGAAPGRPAAARPALWKVADADTTIYLFGTIHALPDDLPWRSPALDQAMAGAGTLVLEVDLEQDPSAAAQAMQRLAFQPGLPPLADRVPVEKRARLEEVVAQTGLPRPVYDAMESWAAAITISSAIIMKAGITPQQGVEAVLTRAFKAAGKSVDQLETVDQQLGLFDGLSASAQRDLLVTTIEETDILKAYHDMADAWASGNTERMAKTFDEFGQYPELQQVMITRRNQHWANWISARLAQPGTVLVAVGTGHLVGKGSVQDHLAQRKIKVSRIQ